MSSTPLHIDLIRRDGGTQPRDHVSTDIARQYAEDMINGAILPPVIVFHDGSHHWLADGFHRCHAHELVGRHEVDADVRQGTRRDAVLFSVGANASHGYRRSNDDKRRAVRTLLEDPEWSGWSDREIARRCHVGADLVGKMRPPPSVAERQTPTRTVSRGGKVYEMQTAGINRERGPEAAAPAPAAAIAPPSSMTGPGSKQLRAYLHARRAGFDTAHAAQVADIGIGEARLHDEAEARGDYASVLTEAYRSPPAEADLPEAASEAAPTSEPPAPYNYERAHMRDSVMASIAVLARAPKAAEVADAWAEFMGHAPPDGQVAAAKRWLDTFAGLFPAAEARRAAAVAAMMEEI